MVQKVERWMAGDGSLHASEAAARREDKIRELMPFIEATFAALGILSRGSAKQFAAALVDQFEIDKRLPGIAD